MSQLYEELLAKTKKLYFELLRAERNRTATKEMYEELRAVEEARLDIVVRQLDEYEARERDRIAAIIAARKTS